MRLIFKRNSLYHYQMTPWLWRSFKYLLYKMKVFKHMVTIIILYKSLHTELWQYHSTKFMSITHTKSGTKNRRELESISFVLAHQPQIPLCEIWRILPLYNQITLNTDLHIPRYNLLLIPISSYCLNSLTINQYFINSNKM